jgi:ankyrin repeat protein
VTFYEYQGELRASIEVVDEKDKVYNSIPVKIGEGADLRSLPHQSKKEQKGRIQLQFDAKGKPVKVGIYKEAGLVGGGKSEDENEEEEEETYESVIRAYINSLTRVGAEEHTAGEKKDTALHLAIKRVNVLLDQLIASQGLELSYRESIDQGSLQYLCIEAIKQVYIQAIIDLLIDKGADIQAINKDRAAPLHIAANEGHTKMVQCLIEKGANKEAKDNNGSTPLHIAACKGYTKVVQCLIEKGADLQARDNAGLTALLRAACNGHLATVKWLLASGASLKEKHNYGNTALLYAACHGHTEVVQLLLDQGADIDNRDRYGRRAIDLARERGHQAIVDILS